MGAIGILIGLQCDQLAIRPGMPKGAGDWRGDIAGYFEIFAG